MLPVRFKAPRSQRDFGDSNLMILGLMCELCLWDAMGCYGRLWEAMSIFGAWIETNIDRNMDKNMDRNTCQGASLGNTPIAGLPKAKI